MQYNQQSLIHKTLQIVQNKTMPIPDNLDRLSALLAGLAPRIRSARAAAVGAGAELSRPADSSAATRLELYLVTAGSLAFQAPPVDETHVAAPAIVLCRADRAHRLAPRTPDTFPGLLCLSVDFDGPVAPLFQRELAEPRCVPLRDAEPSLRHAIALIADELETPRCGQPTLLDRAGDILLIGLLRHLIAHATPPQGLFRALADARIARALVAMHEAPQSAWTLERLADTAGMSRTLFATTFHRLMCQPPGKYLAGLRLAIAQRAVSAGKGLKGAARDAGYASPAALSRALARNRSAITSAPQSSPERAAA